MAGPNSEVTFHGDLNLEPATESEPEQSSSRTMTLEDVINNLCFSEEVRARARARGTTPAAAIMNHFMGVPRQSTSSRNDGPNLTLEDFLTQAGIPNCPRVPTPPQQHQPRPQQQQRAPTPPQQHQPRPQQQQRAPTPPQQPQPPPQQQQRAPTPPQQLQPPPQQQQRAPAPPQQPQQPPQQQQPPVGMLYPNRHGVGLGIPAYGPHHPLGNPAYWHHPFANPAYRCRALGLAQGAFNGMRAPSASVVSHVGVGPPVSPVSSDGESPIQVDTGSQCGLEAGMVGGKKRESDASKEKVVERYHIESPMERRQRKMMQHRDSAARSRSLKQAQLLELALDLELLTQENKELKQTVVELLNKLSQQSGSGSAKPSP